MDASLAQAIAPKLRLAQDPFGRFVGVTKSGRYVGITGLSLKKLQKHSKTLLGRKLKVIDIVGNLFKVSLT